ncbi:MAG: CDP-glycerol glycerophosphotransferase family protein [Coriobacteriia bacterium]|nr:CDP-glycerol glycerophosphotransferase family protein [Coriobacteriia bacterium]
MKIRLLVFAAYAARPLAVLFYAAIKLLRPVQHKITFISRQSDLTPVDFTLLMHELNQQDRSLKIKLLCCSDATRSKRFLGHLRYTLIELWHIANSSAVILDGYALSVSYFPQRKGLYVLQMWHTLGILKRISWQAVDTLGGRDSRVARAFRMHANYSALLVSGEAFREIYRHAFRTARTRIQVVPPPRVDILRKPDMNRIDMLIMQHSEFFARTPLIFYAPTFRDCPEASRRWIADLKALLAVVEARGATLILKTHMRECAGNHDEGMQLPTSPNLIVNPEVDTLDLLVIVDHVITDYSGVAFEAATAGKPLWFYIPDHDDYCKGRGLNVDPVQYMPDACFDDPERLMAALSQASLPSTQQEQFLHAFVQPQEKAGITSAKRIARLVLQSIQ